MAKPLTVSPKLRPRRDHLIVRLDDCEFGDGAIESASAKLTPAGPDGTEPQFRYGLERQQDWARSDQVSVLCTERVGMLIEQPTDDHRVNDDGRTQVAAHASVRACRSFAHSGSGTSSTVSCAAAGRLWARRSASSGGRISARGCRGCCAVVTLPMIVRASLQCGPFTPWPATWGPLNSCTVVPTTVARSACGRAAVAVDLGPVVLVTVLDERLLSGGCAVYRACDKGAVLRVDHHTK